MSMTLDAALNKLCAWRTFFASWQLGSRPSNDGECKAVKDHREVTILLRAELNALTGLLIAKGPITPTEYADALLAEAKSLDHGYEEHFPGWRSTATGMHMKMPEALETMRDLGFPP